MTKNLKMFFIGFFLTFCFVGGINFTKNQLEQFFTSQITKPFENTTFVNFSPKNTKPKPNLQAKSAISVKINKFSREKILYRKNIYSPLPIASLSKLITAIIVLENPNYSLEKTFLTVSEKAALQEDVPNYGNLKIGEGFPLQALFELMLLYSSNDATYAISELIGVENFVSKMNQKVKALGLKNTHFSNPTGLDPEKLRFNLENKNYFNYSTAKDLVEVVKYILKEHPLIFQTTLKKGPYPVPNGISSLSLPENFKMVGGKTGYTNESGGCILFVLEDEKGSKYINIILGAKDPSARLKEAQELINWLQ